VLRTLSLPSKPLGPLVTAIINGTALGVSDGSFMPKHYPDLAMAGWILSNATCSSPLLICGMAQVPGCTHSLNAYRAKLYGLLTLINAVNFLCKQHQITPGHITIGCDNKGAISQINKVYAYIPCSAKHLDLLWTIQHSHQQCPISLSFEYVAGHQDDLSHTEELPPLARLNITADSLACHKLHRLGYSNTPALPFFSLPGKSWYLALADS